MSEAAIDPITLEVIENGLGSLVDRMALTIMRTAYSGVVKDALDYSTGLCDPRGEVLVQGLTIALHLGSFPAAVRAVVEQYAGRIDPGDVFILNDPYTAGGIHLPDIYIIKPIFAEGGLQAFACALAHHTDVGGLVPGSNSTEAAEIYQEGLCLPALKLYKRGVENPAITAIIARNVRVPDKVLGDLRAQLAAAAIGKREYLALADRYGAATLRRYAAELLDRSERLARAEIAALPDGTYRFTRYIDGDNMAGGPVTIAVALTVAGDAITVDFAGSSPLVKAGINSPLPFTRSAVFAAIRLVLDPAIPTSAGYHRPITVVAPPGTVVNPLLPGACGARGSTGFRVLNAVMGALAGAAPERVPADGDGGNTIISLGGYDAEFRPFVYVDLVAGARGGSPWADGVEGAPHPGSNIANTPVEIAQVELPVRIERYGFVPDTGGAGRHRGALAQVREVRCLADEAALPIRSDKRRFPPYGLAGGRPGTPSLNLFNPDGEARLLPTMGTTTVHRGDLLRHVLACGGGWGDPLDRDPARVLADIRNEKITPAYAHREYGVVLDPATGEVDPAATATRRAALRSQPS